MTGEWKLWFERICFHFSLFENAGSYGYSSRLIFKRSFYKMCLVEARKLNRNVDTKSCVVELLVLSGGR